MALTPWITYASAAPSEIKQMTFSALVCKGVGVNTLYPLEVDPVSGALPVSITAGVLSVVDFGATATALRTASVIGNTTGQANFGAGVTTAQTLRTVLASDQAATMATEATLATIAGDTTSLDTKIDVNLSTVATQATLAVVAGDTTSLDTKIDVALSTVATQVTAAAILADTATIDTNTATIAGDTTSLDTKIDVNLSTVATQVTAAAILADTTAILADTATIDTNVATIAGDTTSLDAKITANANAPISTRLSDGTDFLASIALAAAQLTYGVIAKVLHTTAVIVGWDGTNHREIAVDTAGNVKTTEILSNATFQADPNFAGSSLTAAYQDILTAAGNLRAIIVKSTCNETIIVSLDGGTTASAYMNNGDAFALDLGSNARQIASGVKIQAKHAGAAPATGFLRITAMY